MNIKFRHSGFCLSFAFLSILLFSACADDSIKFNPTPYPISFGATPPPPLPSDNIPTIEGVKLGRMLFYEKRLSSDNTLSCGGCHQQKDGFSDIRQFSVGTKGLPGHRQAMPLMNLAWHEVGFFWDGRSATVRDQALHPIQDTLEMNETLPDAVSRLNEDQPYKDQFTRAFGNDKITPERIALAIEQFEFTLISNHSKYDDYLAGNMQLSESEERGRVLFFSNYDPMTGQKGGECFHCHNGFNFALNAYLNNGLDGDGRFDDLGRFLVTDNPTQKGRFKVPSLRNVALTSPYMHDGRFTTLDEVIEHYNTGVVTSETIDESMFHNLHDGGLHLSQQNKDDIAAFLGTLTDQQFINNSAFSDPF